MNEEQVASLPPQHMHSSHPDSTTIGIWYWSRRIMGEKERSGNLANKASHSCSVGFFYMPYSFTFSLKEVVNVNAMIIFCLAISAWVRDVVTFIACRECWLYGITCHCWMCKCLTLEWRVFPLKTLWKYKKWPLINAVKNHLLPAVPLMVWFRDFLTLVQ
jgi:hypothetical protein